ncbi:MAG: hypothetical protein ACI8PB_005530 [Desulforhopalus sp.]|jgi:hypothetical protein
MHRKLFSFICSVSTFILITVYLGAPPAWSAPSDKKPEIQKPADKDVIKPGNLEDGVKGKDSVKKKSVKKAGTAAAIGVAGTKVQSGVKGKVK